MNNNFKQLVDLLMSLTGTNRKGIDKLINKFIDKPETKIELEKLLKLLNNIKKCQKCSSISNEEICHRCKFGVKKTLLLSSNLDLLNLEDKVSFDYSFFVFNTWKSFIKNVDKTDEYKKLLSYIKENNIEELIFSFSPTIETEVFFNVLSNNLNRDLSTLKFKLSKIAIGLPFGGSTEYVDKATFNESLKKRN